MYTSVSGVFRNGHVELSEAPNENVEGSQVIVTFLNGSSVDMRACGISRDEAYELRGRMASFGVDWETPEMSLYDDYDAAKSVR